MGPRRLHADQVDIDAGMARRLLAEQMPRYADRPIRLVPSAGTDNAVFRLGADLALRMPLRPSAVDGLMKEIRWLPVLAPHVSLEVPEVVATGTASEQYPFPWAVVRWLDGLDGLTARIDSMRDAAVSLGHFVMQLRAIDTTGAPPPGSVGFSRGVPLVQRDPAVQSALAGCADQLDIARIQRLWAKAVAAPRWGSSSVWLHTDLLPSNLLVREGRLVGVLDFGAMAIGDPAYDITPAWQVLDRASRALFRTVVDADDAMWLRARGLVVSGGVLACAYYRTSNPGMIAMARRGIDEVLADPD